jgi:hypothetical protein
MAVFEAVATSNEACASTSIVRSIPATRIKTEAASTNSRRLGTSDLQRARTASPIHVNRTAIGTVIENRNHRQRGLAAPMDR